MSHTIFNDPDSMKHVQVTEPKDTTEVAKIRKDKDISIACNNENEKQLSEQLLINELAILRQELEQVKREKADLEILLETKTEQLQQFEILPERETLLQLVLDNIPQLIFWKDRNSVFQGCNRRWAKASNLNHPHEVIGKTESNFHQDSTTIEYYLERDRRVIDTGKSEVYIEYKPEKDIWFDTKKIPIHDPAGNIVGLLGTIEDITQRQKAEEALRIAEENYRSIFENALEGIFQSTPDGKFISVNPAMASIHGYDSPEEMRARVREIGNKVYVDPNCRDEFKRLIEEQGEIKNFEYQVYRQDASLIWVSENTRAVYAASGQLLYYEGIIRDITKRKQEESALKQQVQELQIEIDHQKRACEVAEIIQSKYFQELQADVESLLLDDDL